MSAAPFNPAAIAAALQGGNASALAQAVAGAAVQSITFRSQVSPPISVNPFSPTPPAPPGPNPLMSLIRPAIDVQTAAGTMTIAPYGAPSANYFPWLVAGLALAALGGIALVTAIARRSKP